MTAGAKRRQLVEIKDSYLEPELNEIEQMEQEAKQKEFKMEIVWGMVVFFVVLHTLAAYGFYLAVTAASYKTYAWIYVMTIYSTLSTTGGAHRLWAHKSYKANVGVRIFLMIGQTFSVQKDVINWARDHRVHHKWSDCDADPHNIKRGFFFSHMGWLMCKKHPKVAEMGAKVDLSDLHADPVLQFQRRYYNHLILLSLLILTAVPVHFWGESVKVAFFVAAIFRLTVQYHGTWIINSAAHTFGYKPFDKEISSSDSFFVAMCTNGEAWHNYHHTFPQDYRTSEYMWRANLTACMIDSFAAMGWVWDRKRTSKEAIERQKTLKGDHSRPLTAAHEY